MKLEKPKLTYRDIYLWILDNSKDSELMDKLNFATYPFTSKYKNKYGSPPPVPPFDSEAMGIDEGKD